MITLITGLPGNGKTLYGIHYIKAYAEKESREVFYAGIKDLSLPWTEIKAEDWTTLPAGSIIVIDEAQFVFPKKPNGSKLPEFYEKLAVHRHSGYDIFIITQHPTLIDNFVRQLVGRHLHLIRRFGMQRATIYEYQSAVQSPEKASTKQSAILHKFAYPKEIYGYYKSAEVHTVKRSIPAKLVLAVLFVLAVPVFGYYVLDRFQDKAKGGAEVATSESASSPTSFPSTSPVAAMPAFDPVEDAKLYAYYSTPRVQGFPHTAPRYDEITRPTTAPVPAACIATTDRCKCFTQQATPLSVPDDVCRDIAEFGYFQDFGLAQNGYNGVVSPNAVPLDRIEKTSSRVVSFDCDGYGIHGKRVC